jgi:hypothetical protein
LNPSVHSPHVTSLLTRRWVCLLWICLAFLKCSYRTHQTVLLITSARTAWKAPFLFCGIQVLLSWRSRKKTFLCYSLEAAV